ncbi:hypothetical protein [Starkeya sp. ORNL1]|uniref:hypothetical protein n=1 Tax=Starkeya sp. ORNL1 TaxID=2709380 RepID=UPI001FEF1A41|nr:hypothetical protein [Starkeya sp. ORNL1]
MAVGRREIHPEMRLQRSVGTTGSNTLKAASRGDLAELDFHNFTAAERQGCAAIVALGGKLFRRQDPIRDEFATGGFPDVNSDSAADVGSEAIFSQPSPAIIAKCSLPLSLIAAPTIPDIEAPAFDLPLRTGPLREGRQDVGLGGCSNQGGAEFLRRPSTRAFHGCEGCDLRREAKLAAPTALRPLVQHEKGGRLDVGEDAPGPASVPQSHGVHVNHRHGGLNVIRPNQFRPQKPGRRRPLAVPPSDRRLKR